MHKLQSRSELLSIVGILDLASFSQERPAITRDQNTDLVARRNATIGILIASFIDSVMDSVNI